MVSFEVQSLILLRSNLAIFPFKYHAFDSNYFLYCQHINFYINIFNIVNA